MKKIALTLLGLTAGTLAFASDDTVMLPLSDVVQMGLEQGKLDGSVKFYMSGAKTPKVNAQLGEDVSNKKTTACGKDDATTCNWAALSALMAFQASAKQKGANAVVDLHSFYKKSPTKDAVNYECNIMTGVALKGTYARIGQ
ncbi:MAG: excinuclease ATPase subunit [Comamonas sp.]